MSNASTCPHCGEASVYRHRSVLAGGAGGPDLLPGLGGLREPADFTVLLCADCGLTRFLASEEACSKLPISALWTRVPT